MIYTYDSTMPGAPVVTCTSGALRALLKACLVDGFGVGAVASLVVSGGMATASFRDAHPFKIGSVAQIAGAVPAALNGQWRLTSVTSSSITFPVPGVADGAATGSITSKMAAAGWQELFAGTVANVLVLKPSVVEATGCVLRLDDTAANFARVVGFESMTDAATGVGQFPTNEQFAGGLYWHRGHTAFTVARPWYVFADERSFILYLEPNSTSDTRSGTLFGFGDILPAATVDPYACAVAGDHMSSVNNSSTSPGDYAVSSPGATGVTGMYVARSYSSIGGSQPMVKFGAGASSSSSHSGTARYSPMAMPYPNRADNALRIALVDLVVGAEGVRGQLPGVYHTPQLARADFTTGMRVTGQGEFAGRTFMALRCGPPADAMTSTNAGVAFIDVTGPWRA